MAIFIASFYWNEDNINHLSKHSITPEEAEEAIYNRQYVARTRQNRLIFLGQTDNGRYLKLICHLEEATARVITAYDMSESDKKLCRRRGK